MPIGEVFRFVSSLYFRGKLAYAERYGRPPLGVGKEWLGSGALVITHNRGLLPSTSRVCIEHLEAFAQTDVLGKGRDFRGPLARDATLLADALGDDGQAVLLGSIATDKYVGPLEEALGERLLFPKDFVGRGDMSRGGLLLRHVAAGTELDYVPVRGAVRHGGRPAKLARKVRTKPELNE